MSCPLPLRRACQHMIDGWIEQHRDRVLYWVVVSDKGYVPLAYGSISHTLAGDPKVDVAKDQAMTFTTVSEVELSNLRRAEYVGMGTPVRRQG